MITKYYMVVEACEEWEQPLALRKGQGLPDKGILTWGSPVCLFPSRKLAREAITRTEHYRLAFEEPNNYPDKKFCSVRECVAAEA